MKERDVKALQAELDPYRSRSLGFAVAHWAAMTLLYLAAFAGAAAFEPWPARAAFGLAAGAFGGNLFLIAHDACHGSYTSRPGLNRFLGRLAFLPCYHNFKLWELHHNRIHHAFTNLRGRDYLWLPLSADEYRALPTWRRRLQRAYRTTPGLGLYILLEVWLRRLIVPRGRGGRRDAALVAGFLAAQLSVVAWAAARGRGVEAVALGVWGAACGIVLPMLIICWEVGFVTYFNHTHPDVPWFDRADEWSYFNGVVRGTVHLELPPLARWLVSDVMHHAAHHLHTRVPLVRLRAAQLRLSELLGDDAVVRRWDPSTHREILRRCQLYDYSRHLWLNFGGDVTSRTTFPSPTGGTHAPSV